MLRRRRPDPETVLARIAASAAESLAHVWPPYYDMVLCHGWEITGAYEAIVSWASEDDVDRMQKVLERWRYFEGYALKEAKR